MFKNVSLRPRTVDGRPTWVLLGVDGSPMPAFSAYAHSLRNAAPNTLDSYCRHVAEFVDYLIEVSSVHGGSVTKMQLVEAIEAYGDYLRMGINADKPIACAVAAVLPPGANAAASLLPKKAAVRRFLKLSDDVRKEMAETARMLGSSAPAVDNIPLLPELGKRRKLQPHEVQAMQANSMLAGVLSGGPKFVDCVPLGDAPDSIAYDQCRAFPYDKVTDLIEAAPSYLDKTEYSLLAASGCRTHEALQALIEDIDVVEGTVKLVDPANRLGHPSYRALSSKDRAKLAWKGRTTEITLLIEPFASMFFESLQKYLELEHIPHGRHDFLFQYRSGAHRGMPYFLSDPSTRLERFNKVCERVGVTLPPGTGPHSLRHMYGTYALNYFPRANGDYGLPVSMVQQMMGHADSKSTLRYAKYDKDLLKLEIENANRVLFKNGTPKKILELKLEALEAQVKRLKAQLVQEAIAYGKYHE